MTVLGPGSLVRCVNNSNMRPREDYPHLVVGKIYRVRRAWTVTHPRGFSMEILTLEEYPDTRRFWLDASRFVPVDEGAIDVFRNLLAPSPRERILATREKERA